MTKQHTLAVVMVAMMMGAGVGCDDNSSQPSQTAQVASDKAAATETPPAAPEQATAPAAKLEPTPIVNEMKLIPAGTFTMGSNDGSADEKPPRQLRVAAFEMDIHEVTVRSYMACINDKKCSYPDEDHFCNWGRVARYDDPMNCLEWDQAKEYCESVGKRLPTEAEWEYAARGTDDRIHSWGTGDPPEGLCFNRPNKGTCRVDSVPVDSPFGLRGMTGNVWEWTADGYNANYSKPRAKDRKVYRGVSFLETDKADLRVTVRNSRLNTNRMDYLGFRCARTPKGRR